MKIVFFEASIPDRCGAFYSDLCLARSLRDKGHDVFFVSCDPTIRSFSGGVYEGFHWKPLASTGKDLDQSHIWICPAYPVLPRVRKLNVTYGRPLIIVLHFAGPRSLLDSRVPIKWPEFVWYVNEYIPKACYNMNFSANILEHSLVRPFMETSTALLETPGTADHITLVNANTIKGLIPFLKIATKMPEHKFLGVRSFYYPPTDLGVYVPPNITWIDFTRDIKSIYAQTRILLVLSSTESFCISAAEAMMNGIPVIYSSPGPYTNTHGVSGSTEGVVEWIDPVGIGLPRDDTDAWVAEIQKLDDPDMYEEISTACREHVVPYFDTAPWAADNVVAIAHKHPVRTGTHFSIRNEAPARSAAGEAPSAIPIRPSQPVGWKNGRLTFGRRS